MMQGNVETFSEATTGDPADSGDEQESSKDMGSEGPHEGTSKDCKCGQTTGAEGGSLWERPSAEPGRQKHTKTSQNTLAGRLRIRGQIVQLIIP